MSALRIGLMNALLALAIGGLCNCSPRQAEQLPEAGNKTPVPVQPTAAPKPTPDPRYDRTERDAKLQKATDELLPLFGNMPSVAVFLKDAPVLKNGTNTERSVAYTHCDQPQNPVIFVKKIYYRKANQKQLTNSLKHELTHVWLCRQGEMSAGHDARFRRKFTEVGGFGN